MPSITRRMLKLRANIVISLNLVAPVSRVVDVSRIFEILAAVAALLVMLRDTMSRRLKFNVPAESCSLAWTPKEYIYIPADGA